MSSATSACNTVALPPAAVGPALPYLEELALENCALGDTVPVVVVSDGGADKRTAEPLLPLLARLFPSVRTLDLSYNALTSAGITPDALATLVLADPPLPSQPEDADADDGGLAEPCDARRFFAPDRARNAQQADLTAPGCGLAVLWRHGGRARQRRAQDGRRWRARRSRAALAGVK